MLSATANSFKTGTVQGFTILSSSTAPINFSPSSTDDGPNLGLILGVSIPLFVLCNYLFYI